MSAGAAAAMVAAVGCDIPNSLAVISGSTHYDGEGEMHDNYEINKPLPYPLQYKPMKQRRRWRFMDDTLPRAHLLQEPQPNQHTVIQTVHADWHPPAPNPPHITPANTTRPQPENEAETGSYTDQLLANPVGFTGPYPPLPLNKTAHQESPQPYYI